MGFFKSIGKGISNFGKEAGNVLFGTDVKKAGMKSMKESNQNLKQAADASRKYAGEQAGLEKQFGTGLSQSMGANAADTMNLANQAAQGQAAQNAQAASMAGTRAALQAARSAGLNKGQASLTSGQRAGDIYTQNYQTGLETGRNQYGANTDRFAGQANQASINRLNAINAQGNMATGQGTNANAQLSNATAKTNATIGAGANLAGAAAGMMMMSDERLKDNISGSTDLDEILKKIRPVEFDYKKSSGFDDNQRRKGVLAQQLEGTSLGSAVKETPNGKAIDTNELAPATLNMVLQLGKRIQKLEGKK